MKEMEDPGLVFIINPFRLHRCLELLYAPGSNPTSASTPTILLAPQLKIDKYIVNIKHCYPNYKKCLDARISNTGSRAPLTQIPHPVNLLKSCLALVRKATLHSYVCLVGGAHTNMESRVVAHVQKTMAKSGLPTLL